MSDQHGVARDQLRAFVSRIERLEEEKKTIADDIKDVYGEAKAMGFDTKILKQVIALRKKDDQERTEEEIIRDMYLAALGMIPDFEAEREPAPVSKTNKSPAMALQSPRKAAEAASERTATPFTASDDTPIVPPSPAVREVEESAASNSPETADETQHPVSSTADANARTGGDDSMVRVARTEAAAVTDRRDDHLDTPSEDGAIAAVNPRVGLADAIGVEPSSSAPIAPASQGEAEAPSAERVTPHRSGSAAANAGGSHVDVQISAATHQAGALVKPAPAKSPLRPHCLNPGEGCGGYGTNHCHRCRVAMREGEAA